MSLEVFGASVPWRRCVVAKYGEAHQGWFIQEGCLGSLFFGVQKAIFVINRIFNDQVRFSMGKADRFIFWSDLWVGDVDMWCFKRDFRICGKFSKIVVSLLGTASSGMWIPGYRLHCLEGVSLRLRSKNLLLYEKSLGVFATACCMKMKLFGKWSRR